MLFCGEMAGCVDNNCDLGVILGKVFAMWRCDWRDSNSTDHTFLPKTSKGLANGAQGVVKKIWFDQGSNACSHLPAVIFVKFDGYSGPAWEGVDPSWSQLYLQLHDGRPKQGKL